MPSDRPQGRPGELRAGRRWRRRSWRKTPFFPQTHASECGAVCLGIILAHFGRWVPLSELRSACGISRDGSSAADIVRAAESYGLEVHGWRREPEQLRRMDLPLILFWEFDHFLVLEGTGPNAFYVNDPANGHRKIDAEEFGKMFTGVALALRPGPKFTPGGEKRSVPGQLWQVLTRQRRMLGLAAVLGLLLVLPGIAVPVLVGAFIDQVLVSGAATGPLIVAAALVLAVASLALNRWQRSCLRHVSMRTSASHASECVKHLLRLPLDFFVFRQPGDLVSRIRSIDHVASSAAGNFTGMAIELTMGLLLLGFMLYFDVLLGLLILALALAAGIATRVLSGLRVNESHQLRREQAQLISLGLFGLHNADSLRARGTEGQFFSRFSGYQARELVVRQRFGEMGSLIAAIPAALTIVGSAAVLGIGGLRVFSGALTIGELMALYAVAGNFLAPVGRLVEYADLYQLLDSDLQRLADIELTPRDPRLRKVDKTGEGVASVQGKLRLTGHLKIEELCFGHRRNAPPIINGLNLSIEPGQRVAIVGPSGCGKSTLAQLISGALHPWSGQILFDDCPAETIPRPVMTISVAQVDQHVRLFAATVAENLTMWDATIPERQIVQAARDAEIHDQIVTRPLGYRGAVEEGGRNFSGGQRQRLEIARALVNNPSLLILDEATSALDAELEERIHDAVRRRGCACLIIAHRLSAVRDCDEIIVMWGGRIRGRGRHDELMVAEDDLYRRLVAAD